MIIPTPAPRHTRGSIRRPQDPIGEEAGVVRLDRNQRITPIADAIVRELKNRLSATVIQSYPNPLPFRGSLSQSTGLSPPQITVTAGADAAIRLIFQAFVRPGDVVLLPTPTYSMYSTYIEIFEARLQPIPYGDDLKLDLQRFREGLLYSPRLAVIANPDQPTGAVLPIAVIEEFAEIAARQGTLLLVDEVYFPFYPETALSCLKRFSNVALLRSFSKIFGLAGLRLGFVASDENIIAAIEQVQGLHEVSSTALVAGDFVLNHSELIADYTREVEEGRRVLQAAASALGLTFPACRGNFQIVGVPSQFGVDNVVRKLYEEGFRVRSLSQVPLLRNYFRVALGGIEIMEQFAVALRRAVC